MVTRTLPFTTAAVLALAIVTTHAGGWAVITVEDLPERIIAGQPATFDFSIRQHGMRLAGGLAPSLGARSGGREVSARATAGKDAGYYSASLTVPDAGEWIVTIYSGFGPSNVTLMPVKAMATADTAAADAPVTQRGEQLFVAKGCASCHYHGDVKVAPIARVGSDLTARRYPSEFLARLLSDPSILPSSGAAPFRMPNLNLRHQEISALVAFINRDRTLASR
jgi:mono/diheme cytochrome c family protein